jgi:hypothetical protein
MQTGRTVLVTVIGPAGRRDLSLPAEWAVDEAGEVADDVGEGAEIVWDNIPKPDLPDISVPRPPGF